jgi:hypothetical protein
MGVVLSMGVARAASAQGTGAIGGTITDSTGAALPGAAVVLSAGQGGIGGNQETVADERGAYQFLRLVSGTYTVRAEMQGFRRVEQRNVTVNADVTSRVDLRLEIGTLEEGIVVTAEAPLLDTTTALNQTVLSADILEVLPNRTDVWAIARVIPGIVMAKIDVGGSEAFLQSNAQVRGSSNENGYFIDGMDVNGTFGAGGVATHYLDPYGFQESNFMMGGGSAESQKGGLIYNMIPRTGTNQYRGQIMTTGTSNHFNFANYSDALKAELLAGVPPLALAANPGLEPSADIVKMYEYAGYWSGPIKRDKAWFALTGHNTILDQYFLGSYDSNGKQVLEDNQLWSINTTLSLQVTRASQLSYFNNIQFKTTRHRLAGGQFADSAARNVNQKFPNVNQMKYTTPLGSHVVVDASFSRFRADDEFIPRKEVKVGTYSIFDAVTSTTSQALPTYRSDWMTRQVARSSISFFTSAHDIKAGYELNIGRERRREWTMSGLQNGIRVVYRSGIPDSVNIYSTPTSYVQWIRAHAAFIQDRWRPTRKLTLNLGVRFQTNYGWQEAACMPTTEFVTGRCFDELKGVPNFRELTPRFSMVYDIKGDGRTALKFSANRYVQDNGLNLIRNVNPVQTVMDTRVWTRCASGQAAGCDVNGDNVPQLSELGAGSGFAFGVNNRYPADLKWPVSNEYTIELEQQLPHNMVLSTGFTHRQQRRNIGQRNLAVPASSYTPLVVTERNSGREVTVYNQQPATRGQFDILRANEAGLDTDYYGGDITLNRRMTRWSLMAGASFGKTKGDVLGGDLNNPNSQDFRYGLLGMDVPYSYRLSGVYEIRPRLSVSATGMYLTGFPELTTVSVGNNTVTLTQGTQTVVVEPRGSTRFPNQAQLDMSLRYSTRVAGKSFSPRVDFFNVLNNATITSWVTQLGPTYHRASAIQRGRLIKFGVTIDF